MRKNIINEKKSNDNNDADIYIASFNVFDDKGINTNESKGEIELFGGKWIMRYGYDIDYMLIEKYMIHYIENKSVDCKLCKSININSLRFKSKWLQLWIDTNKDKRMEDCLIEFVDKRYLKILELRWLLHKGENSKKAAKYMNELKKLIENSYVSNDIIYDLENKIIFDFDENKTKQTFCIRDEEIILYLNVKNLFKDGSKEILVSIFEMN
eukprot:128205_1